MECPNQPLCFLLDPLQSVLKLAQIVSFLFLSHSEGKPVIPVTSLWLRPLLLSDFISFFPPSFLHPGCFLNQSGPAFHLRACAFDGTPFLSGPVSTWQGSCTSLRSFLKCHLSERPVLLSWPPLPLLAFNIPATLSPFSTSLLLSV